MKKLILTAIAISSVSCATTVFAQATVVFNNRIGITGPVTHVYVGTFGYNVQGNGPGDIPAGTTSYAGFTLIGTAGGPAGSNYLAQLLGAPGFNAPESSLLPGLGITSFRSGAGAGQVAPTTATFNNIAPDAPAATIEMVAWDNSSGLYPTWTQASVAWQQGLIFAGESGRWNQDALGGTSFAPNMMNTTDPSQHVQSFGFGAPEPATAGLAALGAAALLVFRRCSRR
jgi:hypothetical protein